MEIIQLTEDAVGFHSMNAIAILFAYVTAMYIAGKNLSKFQLILISVLYTFFYIAPSFTTAGNLDRVARMQLDFFTNFPTEASAFLGPGFSPEGFYFNPLLIAFFLAWLASIFFMLDIRRRAKK